MKGRTLVLVMFIGIAALLSWHLAAFRRWTAEIASRNRESAPRTSDMRVTTPRRQATSAVPRRGFDATTTTTVTAAATVDAKTVERRPTGVASGSATTTPSSTSSNAWWGKSVPWVTWPRGSAAGEQPAARVHVLCLRIPPMSDSHKAKLPPEPVLSRDGKCEATIADHLRSHLASTNITPGLPQVGAFVAKSPTRGARQPAPQRPRAAFATYAQGVKSARVLQQQEKMSHKAVVDLLSGVDDWYDSIAAGILASSSLDWNSNGAVADGGEVSVPMPLSVLGSYGTYVTAEAAAIPAVPKSASWLVLDISSGAHGASGNATLKLLHHDAINLRALRAAVLTGTSAEGFGIVIRHVAIPDVADCAALLASLRALLAGPTADCSDMQADWGSDAAVLFLQCQRGLHSATDDHHQIENHADDHPAGAAAAQLPYCPQMPPHLDKVLKFGTKTAVYSGAAGVAVTLHGEKASAKNDDAAVDTAPTAAEKALVKQYDLLQYAEFHGLHRYLKGGLRHPFIHAPTSACVANIATTPREGSDSPARQSSSSDVTKGTAAPSGRWSVLQLQPLLRGGMNLKSHMKAVAEKGVAWTATDRIDVAIQILCMFQFLHSHPLAPFTFDDNHPEQYYLRWNAKAAAAGASVAGGAKGTPTTSPRYDVSLIDLDTLQLARASNNGTVCRCFYCQGRANCMFLNHFEGLLACGQTVHEDDGNTEVRGRRAVEPRCDGPASDSWFLGQVLVYLGTGRVLLPHVPLVQALPIIRAAHDARRAPVGSAEYAAAAEQLWPVKHRTGAAAFDEVALRLLIHRLPPAEALAALAVHCEAIGCAVRNCPRSTPLPTDVTSFGFTLDA